MPVSGAGLQPDTVLVCDTPEQHDAPITVKLADYGLHHVSDGGWLLQSPLTRPAYLSPERVAAGPPLPPLGWQEPGSSNSSGGNSTIDPNEVAKSALADVWSAGILLVEMIEGTLPRPLRGAAAEVLHGVLAIARERSHNCEAGGISTAWPASECDRFDSLQIPLQQLMQACLEPVLCRRKSASELGRMGDAQPKMQCAGASLACLALSALPQVSPPPSVPLACDANGNTSHDVELVSSCNPTVAVVHEETRSAALRSLVEDLVEWRSMMGRERDQSEIEALLGVSAGPTTHTQPIGVFPMLLEYEGMRTISVSARTDAEPIFSLPRALFAVGAEATDKSSKVMDAEPESRAPVSGLTGLPAGVFACSCTLPMFSILTVWLYQMSIQSITDSKWRDLVIRAGIDEPTRSSNGCGWTRTFQLPCANVSFVTRE